MAEQASKTAQGLGGTVRAAILVEQRKPLVIDEIELPAQLAYGQVLVKVHYTTICGAQLNEIDGTKGPDKFLPHLLGHEGGGIVEAVGPGVTTVQPGDRIVLHWRKGAGIESATPTYTWKGKQVNAGWVTTFNEKAVVSENRVTAILEDADLKKAALYGCAVTTGFGVVHNDARMKSGDSLVVFGVGGAGMSVLQAGAVAGANPVIAVDISDYKLKLAPGFGATHTINSTKEDAKTAIRKLLPDGADTVVDATGITAVRELAYELTAKTGTTVCVGVPKAGEKISIDSFPLHFTKRITGSHGGDTAPDHDIPRLMRLERAGRFSLDRMITHTFTLDRINEAIALMRKGDCLRVGIDLTGAGDG